MIDLVEALKDAPLKKKNKKTNGSPKILIWDIENSMAQGYFWGSTYNTNIVKVIKPSSVICFAAKWLGESKTEYYSDFHDGHDEVLARAWELLNEADAVVSYNGKGHDSPHIMTEFKLKRWAPPSPYVEIDLYRVVRRNFKFQQNKLSFVSEQLDIGAKVAHEGLDLWVKCDAGDEKAWAKMKKYNIGDVKLTEDLYYEVLPWIPQSMHPHHALYGPELDVCGRCGSTDLVRQGIARTTLGAFQRYQCRGCGSWSRGKKMLLSANIRGIQK